MGRCHGSELLIHQLIFDAETPLLAIHSRKMQTRIVFVLIVHGEQEALIS
jgi:hypothetical protein